MSDCSYRSQDKSGGGFELPIQNSSDKCAFEMDDISPVSPRESPKAAKSSPRNRHRHRHNSHRHERDESKSRDREKRKRDEKDRELSSERKRPKVDHESKREDKHSKKDRDKERKKESRKERHKSHKSRDKQERKEKEEKTSKRQNSEIKPRPQYTEEKSVDNRKSDHSRSTSRHSSLAQAHSSEGKPSPALIFDQSHTNPFVAALLKSLEKEDTSDTELESLLNPGVLSGESAKRSLPLYLSSERPKRESGFPATFKSQSRPVEDKADSSSAKPTESESKASNLDKKSQSVDEMESRFDKFLSNLSDKLQEKEQEVETWSAEANEVDFSDILIEEESTIRLAASSACLKSKQLLEAYLSTPWDSIERRMDEDMDDKDEKTEEDKEEDPFDLSTLLSANISRRYLDEELAKELEERGISLSGDKKNSLPVVDKFTTRMVPGVYEERAWRQSLLGVIRF